MSKLEKLISELCPNGVEFKTIGEIALDIYRGTGVTRDQVTTEGIPCVRYGEIYTTYDIWFDKCVSYTDEEIIKNKKYFEYGDILFAITGESVEDIAKSCVYVGNEKCIAGGDIVVLKHKQDPKYLSYALSTTEAQKQKSKGKVKSKVVHSSVPAIKEITIPVPPLSIQEEIARILDNFTELTAELTTELTAELTARQKQYEHYRDKLLTFSDEVEWKTLGDIGKVSMCKRIFKEQTQSNGEIPFYKIGTFGKEADAYISQELFEEYKQKYSYPKKGEILISASGTIGRTVIFDGIPSYFQDSNIVWIANDEKFVLNKFLFHFYKITKWAVSEGGAISRLYNDNMKKTQIPVPPIEEQQYIVEILDRFDSLCNDITQDLPAEIEARKKQYEYYRDKLLTFKEIKK